MMRADIRTILPFVFLIGGSLAFAYMIDQYYFAGKGYTFFFDILKL